MNLVEIEKSVPVITSVCYRPGIWSFPVFENGQFFSWFSTGGMDTILKKAGSVTVNNINYTRVDAIANLYPGTFCQAGNTVYLMNDDYLPLWLYRLPHYNVIIGFTDGKPFARDGILYIGGVDYVTNIADAADNLEYGRMKFKNENISLLNTKGEYDQVTHYFGNNLRIKSEINGSIKDLYEYYIKNVRITADKTTFVCGDRREKLQQKVPSRKFTKEEFRWIKSELAGGTMQDVYGRCEWVKCVCVDELNVYTDANNSVKKTWRTFYAARKITKLELVDDRNPNNQIKKQNSVWVKMTQIDKDAGSKEIWTPQQIDLVHSDFSKGLFALDIKHCMPANWDGYDVPEIFEVCACGIFWAGNGKQEVRPLDVIRELLSHYCGIPDNGYTYNQMEVESEIGGLAPIGIVYDHEINVFEAIEKLQDSSDYGFRFMTDYNRFTARKDDNYRPPLARTIAIRDIEHIGKIEIDMRQDNYATIIDITYNRNWYQETAGHYEGAANREELLRIHGIDKVYGPGTYLITEDAAKAKAVRLEDFFRKNRVLISNVEVLNHAGLRVYDIVYVDLRIPIERKHELKQVLTLFSHPRETVAFGDWPGEKISVDFGGGPPAYRTFGGILKCKVMSVKLNLETMVNAISLLEVG